MTTAKVKTFQELTPDLQTLAGGKGGMLAKLFQDGYPVPEGLVVLPAAFQDETLDPAAWKQIQTHLQAMRQNGGTHFAVRSSASSEDSAQTSFAGEFETILNTNTDEEIRKAIHAVYRSRQSERVQAYTAAHGLEQAHRMAVVIQRMVPSEISGVLFTADPVTGSYTHMIGNYVYGLGEQLVAGEANASAFELLRPRGKYNGPAELKQHASALYQYAIRLEKELGRPQDIEWAVAQGKLYLLQTRPITTLTPGNLDTYEINESLAEDALWINTNVAEAIPDVFSPLTWSVIRELDVRQNFIPGYYIWSGNICGRVYSNISRRVSVVMAITGWDANRVLKLLGDLFGQTPEGMHVPVRPYTRIEILREILPRIWGVVRNTISASRNLPQFLRGTPDWCSQMTARITKAKTKEELISVWRDELQPYSLKAWWSHAAASSRVVNIMLLDRKLKKLVGTEDTNALLSNLRGDSGLASLGPLVGISRMVQGEMSRENYLRQYGHRGPHEFELSIPDPAEDANWLERQIEEFERSAIDVEALLKKQQTQHEAARRRFQERYPRKAKWLDKQLAKTSQSAHLREAARSEFTRVFRLIRAFALKAGALTGIGEAVFFLYIDEILDLLSGKDGAGKHIPARQENYEKYKTLPPFPSVIRGRFDPFEWAKDPNRRIDYYDATMPVVTASDSEILKGIAGAAGRVEGNVRVLSTPEAGETLQPGEVLVAATTNVGWTPLFPKAAAIITDVGAPLSHAAIVARELGIPAVVGCGNATTRLKTGDKVLVDGGQGTVHLLNQ